MNEVRFVFGITRVGLVIVTALLILKLIFSLLEPAHAAWLLNTTQFIWSF